jgi:nucleoside-diphosphate-sugar epimerase
LRTETDRAAPISNYGRSKRAGEQAAAAAAHLVPVSVVRPGIVFGPRNRELLPIFQTIYRAGIHVVPTHWPPRISLIHHEDLVEILVRVARDGTRIRPAAHPSLASRGGGYYLVGDPEPVTYEQLGRLIADGLGCRHPLMFYFAEPLLWLAAAGNELVARLRGQPDAFNIDKIREATAGDWVTSPSALQRELDFIPPKSLARRFRETGHWYLEQGWL